MKGKVKKDAEDEKKEEPIEVLTIDSTQLVEVPPTKVEDHPVEVEAAPVKLLSEPPKSSVPV